MADTVDTAATRKPDFIERAIARWARKHRISATVLAVILYSSALGGQPPPHPYLSPAYFALYLAICLHFYLRHEAIEKIPYVAFGFTMCALIVLGLGFWITDGMGFSYSALGRAFNDTGLTAAFRASNAVWMAGALLVRAWAKGSVAHLEGGSLDEKRVGDLEEGGGLDRIMDEKQGLHEKEEAKEQGVEID